MGMREVSGMDLGVTDREGEEMNEHLKRCEERKLRKGRSLTCVCESDGDREGGGDGENMKTRGQGPDQRKKTWRGDLIHRSRSDNQLQSAQLSLVCFVLGHPSSSSLDGSSLHFSNLLA